MSSSLPMPSVLVVDDDCSLAESLKRLVETQRPDAAVRVAVSYKEALRELRNTPAIDIIVTDIDLNRDASGESGLTLLDARAHRERDLTVIGLDHAASEDSESTLLDELAHRDLKHRAEWLNLYRTAKADGAVPDGAKDAPAASGGPVHETERGQNESLQSGKAAQGSPVRRTKLPDFPRAWMMFAFILPRKVRLEVFDPACHELKEDFLLARRRLRTRREQRWLTFCFTVHTTVLVAQSLHASFGDRALRVLKRLGLAALGGGAFQLVRRVFEIVRRSGP